MATTVIGASVYDVMRAQDGWNYGIFMLIRSAPQGPSASIESNPFMCFGPGATPAVPATRLYWCDSFGDVYYTDGVSIVLVPGGPGIRASGAIGLIYDSAHDILTYAWVDPVGPPVNPIKIQLFDGTTWTQLGDFKGIDVFYFTMAYVPTTALDSPGRLLVASQYDSTPQLSNWVQHWNGAGWINELFTDTLVLPKVLAPYGDTVMYGLRAEDFVWDPNDPLVYQRSSAGVWTDITPASWKNEVKRREVSGIGEYNGLCYVCFHTIDDLRREVWTYDGAVWAMVADLTVLLPTGGGPTDGGYLISFAVIDGVLHCGMDWNYQGQQYLTYDGAVWARNALPLGLPYTFGIASIQFFIEQFVGIRPTSGNCSGESSDPIAIVGDWDAQPFVAWDPATVWDQTEGLWTATSSPSIGSQVHMGSGLVFGVSAGNPPEYTVGEIDVIDPFVLTGQPPNGKGFVHVEVDNALAPGHAALGNANFPLFLTDGYEFVCPAIDSVDPPSGDVNGGFTVTLRGTNFFANQINPSLPVNWARVVNRIWVRSGLGTLADPYRIVEVDPRTITFVDTETISFPMASYPGGADAVVDLFFQPAGLAPFSFGAPVGITPSYRCALLRTDFTYTGVTFLILGSLETLLGLGGTGGDVEAPTASGAGGAVGQPHCPTDVTPGPCLR